MFSEVWSARSLLIGIVLAGCCGVLARLLEQVSHINKDVFFALWPISMSIFMPVAYRDGVQWVMKKEGLRPPTQAWVRGETKHMVWRALLFSFLMALLAVLSHAYQLKLHVFELSGLFMVFYCVPTSYVTGKKDLREHGVPGQEPYISG